MKKACGLILRIAIEITMVVLVLLAGGADAAVEINSCSKKYISTVIKQKIVVEKNDNF